MEKAEAIRVLGGRAEWCRRWVTLHGGSRLTEKGAQLAYEAEAIDTVLSCLASAKDDGVAALIGMDVGDDHA